MAKITYTDQSGSAPTISWLGHELTSTIPHWFDDELHKALIEAARLNPFFTVEDGDPPKGHDAQPAMDHDETIVGKGEAASREGKPRLVPVAYRGADNRAKADAWLYGYDRIPTNTDPFAEDPAGTGGVADDKQPDAPLDKAKEAEAAPAGPVSGTQALSAAKDDKKGKPN